MQLRFPRACLGAATIIAGFAAGWIFLHAWTAWPRFHAAAWRDARELLAAEVGAQALERGVFAVPRIPVSVPHRGRAAFRVTGEDDEVFLVIFTDGCKGRLLVASFRPGGDELRIPHAAARVSAAEARRLWAALRYIAAITTKCDARPVFAARDRLWHVFVNGSWPLRRIDETTLMRQTMRERVVAKCVRRFITGAVGGERAYRGDFALVVPLMADTIDALLPLNSRARSAVAGSCVVVARGRLDPAFLPALRKLERALREGALYRTVRKAPLLRRLPFPGNPAYDYTANDIEGEIWVLENIAGRRDGEAFDILAAKEANPRGGSSARAARRVLKTRWPRRWREHLRKCFLERAAGRRLAMARYYESWFGTDETVLETMLTDANDEVRAWALRWAYKFRRDKSLLDDLLMLAFPGDEALQGEKPWLVRRAVKAAQWALRDLYLRDGLAGELPGIFRERRAEVDPFFLCDVLAREGGVENAAFLENLAVAPAFTSRLTDEAPAVGAAWRAAAVAIDPEAANYLDAVMPNETPQRERLMYRLVKDASGGKARRAARGRGFAHELGPGERSPPLGELKRALVLKRELESAVDPVAFLDSLGGAERRLAGKFIPAVFSEGYSEAELKGLTGDPRFEDLAGRFYEALILRRAAGARPAANEDPAPRPPAPAF